MEVQPTSRRALNNSRQADGFFGELWRHVSRVPRIACLTLRASDLQHDYGPRHNYNGLCEPHAWEYASMPDFNLIAVFVEVEAMND